MPPALQDTPAQSPSPPPVTARGDGTFFVVNGIVSTLALMLLGWLLLAPRALLETGVDLRFMPKVNAALNAIAAGLLVAGRRAIARRDERLHRGLMVAAFVASTLFLAGYLGYHAVHGDTRFGGVGAVRWLYLALLASHVVASLGVVPLAFAAFYFAWQRRFDRHVSVTRWLHPLWLYVSVTGVLVYLMLRPYYPG